ncbi:Gfo/Idh/MocA family oxidoreductase [Paenibacillus sp.]|uniref:Gfo/Idh/MocA family protein n=1 Tax=Paenibacillus sp. TaxID=58172 RepID=UPI002812127F|nr:Gfo/Idh/MocA family oxidoreductase [Paenibacillus sp.]
MKRVKVGIVGFGSWGACHLEAYRAIPHVEVVAVCDADPARRVAASDRHVVPHVYENAGQLLDRHPDIELVSIVTYEKNHLESTMLALRARKAVIVEKPVAIDVEEAKAMQRAATESDAILVPGHLLRFDPKYGEIRAMLEDGGLGKPISMYLKRSRQSSLFQTYKRTHTVYELMIHDLDQAIWYAGSRVKEVYASGAFLNGGDSPEVLWAQLRFENSVLAVLHSNWMTPDAAGIAIHDYTEVIGERGIAHFDTHAAGIQWWGTRGRTTTDVSVHHHQGGRVVGALKEQLSYVSQCVLEGVRPGIVSFDDAVHGIEVAAAIVASASSGRPVIVQNR